MDVNRNLILVEFGKISKLMEFNRFFRYRVDISKNLKLIDPSRFPKFQFKVRVAYYKAFLYIIRGSK